jgi:polysaccharide transporter, PST family
MPDDVNSLFEDNKHRSDLGGRAVRDGMLLMLSRGVQGVFQLASSLILARLLAPEDFGLVAIVIALTSFAPMLIDLGLGDATVQRSQITPSQVTALFWINVGLGCAVALLLVGGSSLIGSIYRQPRLAEIAAAFAITFVLNSLAVQHLALLRRNMRFTEVVVIENVAFFGAAGTAITMAALGSGYWALVTRPIVASAILVAGAWLRCNWRPGLPSRNLEIRSMLKFGLNVSFGAVAVIIANSIDRTVLGYMYAPRLVGLYQNALLMYENAAYGIFWPLHRVGLSALSKLQDDAALFKQKYLSALGTVSFYSMPAFAILVVIAPDLVPLLMGEKWTAAGAILRIFAIGGIVHIVEASQNWLHLPLGRPDRGVRWAVLTALVQGAAVVSGLPFGIEGVATAIVIGRAALAFPAIAYAGRPVHLQIRAVFQAVGKQLFGAIVVLAAGYLAMNLLPANAGRVLRILVGSTAGAGIYLLLVVGVIGLKEPLRLSYSIFRRMVPKRFHSWLPSASGVESLSGAAEKI